MSRSTIHLAVDSGPKQGGTIDRKPGSVIRIGRVVKGNTLAVKDPAISQKHLTIEFDPEVSRWALRDLDTSNGTFVNGQRVPSTASVHLSDGDSIKIGECSSISVKISVIEENAEGIKRNGGKKGGGRSKRADDCEEVERVSSKDEILDSGVQSRCEKVAESLKSERKRGTDGNLSKDETEGDGTKATNLGRGRRKNPTRGLQENKILGAAAEGKTEMPMNSGKSSKAVECEEIMDPNLERGSVKDYNSDAAMHDGAKEASKCRGKRRKQNSRRGSKKVEILESTFGNGIEEEHNLVDRNPVVANKDEVLEKAVEGTVKVVEILGRGRRRKSAKVPGTDGAVEDNVIVQKNLGTRRRSRSSTQLLGNDPSVALVVVGKTKQPENFGKHREESSTSSIMPTDSLEQAVKTTTEAHKSPRRVGRGRKSILDSVPKKGEVLEDNMEVPKTSRGGRRTRSKNVSEKDEVMDLVAEDKIQLPKNAGRQRRASSARISKLDAIAESVLEDITEAPKNLARGERVTSSSKVSDLDEVSNIVMEDAVDVGRNVHRGKTRRAPARRTRASSGVSKDQQLHQPAQLNLKGKVLNPVENLHYKKEAREGSHQVGQLENVKQSTHISSSPGDSKGKRQIGEDKENYVSVKCQRTDSEGTVNSFYRRNPGEERPIFGSADIQCNKPSRLLPKVWNGNGIPNSTSKYKEDSKVSWHATPFEERLEKALSGDKMLPQRKITD